jgi:hypothetical protein
VFDPERESKVWEIEWRKFVLAGSFPLGRTFLVPNTSRVDSIARQDNQAPCCPNHCEDYMCATEMQSTSGYTLATQDSVKSPLPLKDGRALDGIATKKRMRSIFSVSANRFTTANS